MAVVISSQCNLPHLEPEDVVSLSVDCWEKSRHRLVRSRWCLFLTLLSQSPTWHCLQLCNLLHQSEKRRVLNRQGIQLKDFPKLVSDSPYRKRDRAYSMTSGYSQWCSKLLRGYFKFSAQGLLPIVLRELWSLCQTRASCMQSLYSSPQSYLSGSGIHLFIISIIISNNILHISLFWGHIQWSSGLTPTSVLMVLKTT